jgi:hypothetical protein
MYRIDRDGEGIGEEMAYQMQEDEKTERLEEEELESIKDSEEEDDEEEEYRDIKVTISMKASPALRLAAIESTIKALLEDNGDITVQEVTANEV